MSHHRPPGPVGASSTRFLGRFPYRVDGPPTGAHIPADSVLDEGVAQPLAGNSARRRSSRLNPDVSNVAPVNEDPSVLANLSEDFWDEMSPMRTSPHQNLTRSREKAGFDENVARKLQMPVGPMDALSPIMADAQRPSINNGNTPATPKNPGKVSEMNDSDVVQKSPIGKDRSAVRQRKKCIVEHSSLRDSLTELEKCELSHWGLPEMVLMRYRQKGISSMFPWQSQCLTVGSVLEGGNLVYSAPTSAGKTLVAELLLIKRVLESRKKGIIILPFVSLAREKMFALQALLQDLPIRVMGFMGSQSPPGGLKRADLAICTIEKANGLINRALEDGSLSDIGCVVVDELHLLGDPSRGYLLELLLTKIRYMSFKEPNCDIQIIGMSATLPNLDLLALWLDADLFKTDFRPVPLTETIKVGNRIFSNHFEFVRGLKPPVHIENDSDHLVYLCLETILGGHSVLVFCPTKNWCETLADTVAKAFFQLGRPNPSDMNLDTQEIRAKIQSEIKGKELQEVMEQLKRSPAGLDPVLAKAISFGVAYHHAGLTFDERDIIEGSFKRGALRVLIATSTLSSGVNLPARRVIVRSPFTFKNQLIDTLSYKQMIGRAGRKGVDTEGESILFCRENEKDKVVELVSAPLQPVRSCLVDEQSGETIATALKRALLEVVASGVATTPEEVEKYASCTMLAASIANPDSSKPCPSTETSISGCIQFLEENEFIRLQSSGPEAGNPKGSNDTRYVPTQLGLACLASSLSPDEGLKVFVELAQARKCFVLENELHILYQVVPLYAAVSWPNLDWMNFLSLWEGLSPDMKRVGELIGVEERFLVRAMRGTLNQNSMKQAKQMAIHQRFYTALALHDLVNEIPLKVVSQRYGSSKGMLQSLQQAASTFAGMVTAFCHKLGWFNLELLIGQFQDRLQFGIHRDLIDLCRLNTLNGQRARILHNAKVETVAILANSSPNEIETILLNSMPFESGRKGETESEFEAVKRREMRSFWVTGQKGLTISEASKAVVEEARDVLQKDLCIQIDWASKEDREKNLSAVLNESATKRTSAKSKKTSSKKSVKTKVNPKPTSTSSKALRARYVQKPRLLTNASSSTSATASKVSPHLFSLQGKLGAQKRTYGTIFDDSVKASRKSLEHVSPREYCSTPVASNGAPRASVGPEDLPRVESKGGDMIQHSFDVSGQLDEIFQSEMEEANSMSKPILRTPPLLKNDGQDDAFSADLFHESSFPLNEIPHSKANRPVLNRDLQSNRSCPETPRFEVCSEELLLRLSSGSDQIVLPQVRDDPISSQGNAEEDAKNSDKRTDFTISDSFLEGAMDTHMSEGDDIEKEGSFIVPLPRKLITNNKNIEPNPSPQIRSARLSRPLLKADTPDTPKSEKSVRLSKRRQVRKGLQGQSRISPGFLIMSDSDSEGISASPQMSGCSLPNQIKDLTIVDVCSQKVLFEAFFQEWSSQAMFSLALACQNVSQLNTAKGAIIGGKMRKGSLRNTKHDSSEGLGQLYLSSLALKLVGIAVSWEPKSVFYIHLDPNPENETGNDSLAPPSQDSSLTLKRKLEAMAKVFNEGTKTQRHVAMFDSKAQLKVLYLTLGLLVPPSWLILDPKVGSWMLQPTENERNLANLVMSWDPSSKPILEYLGSAPGCGSVGLNREGTNPPRLRAVSESLLTWRIMGKIKSELESIGMWKAFTDVEMPSILSLLQMELNGVGFSEEEAERQRKIIVARMADLQTEAFKLAGREFALSSPNEVCKILYQDLKLPLNGDPSLGQMRSIRSTTNRLRNFKAAPSCGKDILIKLKAYHDLPNVIMEWRKLNMTLTKVVGPLMRSKDHHSVLKMDRIYPVCQTLTATGRISLQEPNIQNIPKDFEIPLTEQLKEKALGRRETRILNSRLSGGPNSSRSILSPLASYLEDSAQEDSVYKVSMRHAIVPRSGFLILAADYSQLELRILAHMSGDEKLCLALNEGQDVFKTIAAAWKHKAIEMINDDERQQAKQICYGMIYGIGVKSLGEQLGVVEEEASAFIHSFKATYPGIKDFMDKTLVECRQRGYVETMNGRRRYLPKVTNSANQFIKAAAERQAINTTIQGSAADLVKRAMNAINERLVNAFPGCDVPFRQSNCSTFASPKSVRLPLTTNGGFFLLQMHDELIYEVSCQDVLQVSQIVRMSMENACQLKVKIPVKVKIGPSWGQLQDMKE